MGLGCPLERVEFLRGGPIELSDHPAGPADLYYEFCAAEFLRPGASGLKDMNGSIANPIALANSMVGMSVTTWFGTFIGAATRAGANGEPRAIEVLVFPEAMRGAGEDYYPWDLEPGSMMTNATVPATVRATSGRELSLSYKGGHNTIVVPPDAPVVTFAPADQADLKVGATIFLSATKNAESKLTASRVIVGKNGVAPPNVILAARRCGCRTNARRTRTCSQRP